MGAAQLPAGSSAADELNPMAGSHNKAMHARSFTSDSLSMTQRSIVSVLTKTPDTRAKWNIPTAKSRRLRCIGVAAIRLAHERN
jgi:hypothetical protein